MDAMYYITDPWIITWVTACAVLLLVAMTLFALLIVRLIEQ